MSRFSRRAVLVAVAAFVSASCAQFADLPTLSEQDLKFRLPQTSAIYASDGKTLITTLHGEQNRTIVPLERMPEHLREAVIAIEDERFYEHEGVDLKAIVRAFVSNASSGEIKEGGSTITQQYVKNVIIAPGETAEKTLRRKVNEAALARQLEQRLPKNEILERYLNTVYFGQGAYGVEAAAQAYFSVPAHSLSLTQSATLAGLIRSPESYDPIKHPEEARQRRDLVLDKMAELGYLTQTEAEDAKSKKLRIRPKEEIAEYPAPYFVDYVQRLITYDGEEFRAVGKTVAERTRRLFQGGLKIYTTVDLEAQAAAEEAIDSVLTEPTDPHASIVAIEPETGHVKAMVGGRDWFAKPKNNQFAKFNLAIAGEPGLGRVKVPGEKDEFLNQAPGTGRQAGSAFKPFALAAALENGISLSKVYPASGSMDFAGADVGGTWHVSNYEGSAFGAMSLLDATVRSVNVVYAQVILEVGAQAVTDLAREAGINTELLPVPSAVLGANPVNPLGMANGYATFARAGKAMPPVAVTKIVDTAPEPDRVIYRAERKPEEVMSESTAYLVTQALQQVISRGTAARYAPAVARPAAGKTGTAQEYRDAWFVGYTPDLVTSVWVGYPEGEIEMKSYCSSALCRPTRLSVVTGGSWPTQIWTNFMIKALAEVPASSFEIPELASITVTIDTRTGCLADELTPEEFQEDRPYTIGNEPTESCREKGPKVRVPDVFGFPFEEASRVLISNGFTVVREDQPTADYPPGRVIGQEPGPGTKLPQGEVITLIVSVPGSVEAATVPDVLGYEREEAEAALAEAGFGVRVIEQSETNHPNGVWKQSPPGGTELERGGVVTIYVNPP